MRPSSVKGLSLVELMVALALSAFLVSGLIYVFVGSKQAYRTSDALARVQESGRFALEMMASDLRHAGYSVRREACGPTSGESFSAEDPPGSDPGSLHRGYMRIALNCFAVDVDGNLNLDQDIEGCSGVADWYGALAPVAVPRVRGWHFLGNEDRTATGWNEVLPDNIKDAKPPPTRGDVIRIERPVVAGRESSVRVSEQHAGANRLHVLDPAAKGLDTDVFLAECGKPANRRSIVCADDIVLVVNSLCNRATVFQVSGAQVNVSGDPDGTIRLSHAAGTASPPHPRNRTNALGTDFVGGFVFRGPVVDVATAITYYLADASVQEDTQSLYRVAGEEDPEELVSGIEGMIIEYAEANSDDYRTADQVADWTRIASARVSFLAVGPEDNVVPVAQSEAIFYPYASPEDFGDRRLRQAFRATVFFRNPGR